MLQVMEFRPNIENMVFLTFIDENYKQVSPPERTLFSRNVILSLLALITSDPKHDAVRVIGRLSSTKLTAKEKLPSPTSNTVSPATNVSGCIIFN